MNSENRKEHDIKNLEDQKIDGKNIAGGSGFIGPIETEDSGIRPPFSSSTPEINTEMIHDQEIMDIGIPVMNQSPEIDNSGNSKFYGTDPGIVNI